MNPFPDLVRDSKLDTRFHAKYTSHRHYDASLRPGERPMVREEYWRRDKLIGGGSYGRVWLERCLRGERGHKLRAIKELVKTRELHKPVSFHRELEAMAKFSHQKYVRCFVESLGWFETADTLFIAMEYFPHGDLRNHLCVSPPLPELEAQQVTFQLVEGLAFLHENGFAHRDLKPSNILVKSKPPEPWWVKIGDFGISKRAEDSTAFSSTIKGTLGYMAPELHGFVGASDTFPDDVQAASRASDMWSLGEIAFQMLTKEASFRNMALLFAFVQKPALFPRGILIQNQTSDIGVTFIQCLMDPRPKERMRSEQALRHEWTNSWRPPSPKPPSIISFGSTESYDEIPESDWAISSDPSGKWSTVSFYEVASNDAGPSHSFNRSTSNQGAGQDCQLESSDPMNVSTWAATTASGFPGPHQNADTRIHSYRSESLDAKTPEVYDLPGNASRRSTPALKSTDTARPELRLSASTPIHEPNETLICLRSANRVDDPTAVSYPSGIIAPKTDLCTGDYGRRHYRYDREFLLQFQNVFKEKPSLTWDEKIQQIFCTGESVAEHEVNATSQGKAGYDPPYRRHVVATKKYAALPVFKYQTYDPNSLSFVEHPVDPTDRIIFNNSHTDAQSKTTSRATSVAPLVDAKPDLPSKATSPAPTERPAEPEPEPQKPAEAEPAPAQTPPFDAFTQPADQHQDEFSDSTGSIQRRSTLEETTSVDSPSARESPKLKHTELRDDLRDAVSTIAIDPEELADIPSRSRTSSRSSIDTEETDFDHSTDAGPDDPYQTQVGSRVGLVVRSDGSGEVEDATGKTVGYVATEYRTKFKGFSVTPLGVVVDGRGEAMGHASLYKTNVGRKTSEGSLSSKTGRSETPPSRTGPFRFGHLVFDMPKTVDFLKDIPHVKPPDRDEFTHARYTAVISKPTSFKYERFPLRPGLFQKPRRIELVMAITFDVTPMADDFATFLRDLFQSMSHMSSSGRKYGPKRGWRSMAVIIVVKEPNKRMVKLFANLGLETDWCTEENGPTAIWFPNKYNDGDSYYDDGINHPLEVGGDPVYARIYEYTTQKTFYSPKASKKATYRETVISNNHPMQLILCRYEGVTSVDESEDWLDVFKLSLNPRLCIRFKLGDTMPHIRLTTVSDIWKAEEPRDCDPGKILFYKSSPLIRLIPPGYRLDRVP